jgi:hypothetical protein
MIDRSKHINDRKDYATSFVWELFYMKIEADLDRSGFVQKLRVLVH